MADIRPPQIDFSPLVQMGQQFGNMRREQQLGAALSALPPNASWEERANAIMKINPELGIKMFQYGDTLNLGRERNTIAAAKVMQPKPLGATDKRILKEAEEYIPSIDDTIATLEKARNLNDKTYDGYFAGVRGSIGAKGPDWIPDQIAEPEQAKATNEWELTMSPVAIEAMASTLKGATTDYELRYYLKQLADPSTPKPTRKGIIDKLHKLATDRKAVRLKEIQEIRAGGYGSGGEEADEPEVGFERDSPQGRVRYIGDDQWELVE